MVAWIQWTKMWSNETEFRQYCLEAVRRKTRSQKQGKYWVGGREIGLGGGKDDYRRMNCK